MKKIIIILVGLILLLIGGCNSQDWFSFADGFNRGYSSQSPYRGPIYNPTSIEGILYNQELDSMRFEMDWQNLMRDTELMYLRSDIEMMRSEMLNNQILNDGY